MSHTDRNKKYGKRERPFPYIPHGVPIVSNGRANGEDDNMAVVRAMARLRDPEWINEMEFLISQVLLAERQLKAVADEHAE